MKRLAYVLIAAGLLASLLVGCGSEVSTTPAPDGTTATTTDNSEKQNINNETTENTEPSDEIEDTTQPSVTEPVHEHKHSPTETVQPTCTEEGYTIYVCECGDSYHGDQTEPLEHNYELTDTVEPTRDTEGYSIFVCKVCFGSKRDDYVPAIEEELNAVQRNSINMLNYLATISERINVSKGNRLMLEEVYTILLNNINPQIDEETQEHMEDLRYIIGNFIDTSVKRERLQYLYNQDKANAIRSAVPDPLSVLSISNALDWKRLAASVVFTVVDSYNNYASQVDSLDREYLISSWELDDAETATIRRNRGSYFDYMVDIVQQYQFDGNITLNENAVKQFVAICEKEDLAGKVQSLESKKSTYEHFANYWLELADCYYELGKYDKCLSCIDTYKNLSVGIFRKDYDYAQILPKVIVAAQTTKQSVSVIEGFADDIIDNSDNDDWALRYFAAQVYVDLYSRNHQKAYLEKAYQIALDNVNELKGEQQKLNKTYLADVEEIKLAKPNYDRMNEQEKKEAKEEYQAEKKRVDAYNKTLKETRKTELPPLYEPLVVNCDLLFALADKLNIGRDQKTWIETLLLSDTNGVFISDAINDRYSFSKQSNDYAITYNATSIEIPANLLTQGATIEVVIKAQNKTTTLDDWSITKVKRDGSKLASFIATYSSDTAKDVEWSVGAEITVNINNGEGYDPQVFRFKVVECKKQFPFGSKPIFEML